jgi:hypothetical protein
MKFSEKYSQLKNKQALEALLVSSIYTTMALEDQTVPKSYLLDVVKRLLSKRRSK